MLSREEDEGDEAGVGESGGRWRCKDQDGKGRKYGGSRFMEKEQQYHIVLNSEIHERRYVVV